MKRSYRRLLVATIVSVASLSLSHSAVAYNFWRQYNGRTDWRTGNFYDLTDKAWVAPAGAALTDRITFDWSMAFPADGPFTVASVRDTWRAEATAAISDWAAWANIKLGTEQAAGAGQIRFSFNNDPTAIGLAITDPGDATKVIGAPITFQLGKAAYWDRPYYMGPGNTNPDPAAVPIASQIRFSTLHEVGHALGLDDLYLDYAEEFVDHPVAGNTVPDRNNASRQDNIMQGCDAPGATGCNYAHNPVIDNDEIAGAAWLWGGPYSQIVNGDLKTAWNHASLGGRDTIAHHGDQDNPAGWWDYRGSFANSYLLTQKPYIDIEFPGFTGDFKGYSGEKGGLGPGTDAELAWKYLGNQGGATERFELQKAGFVGNFILSLKSLFTDEQRVNANVVTGGYGVSFSLNPNLSGLTYDTNMLGGRYFAKVFGPVPEPASLSLFVLGMAALLVRRPTARRSLP